MKLKKNNSDLNQINFSNALNLWGRTRLALLLTFILILGCANNHNVVQGSEPKSSVAVIGNRVIFEKLVSYIKDEKSMPAEKFERVFERKLTREPYKNSNELIRFHAKLEKTGISIIGLASTLFENSAKQTANIFLQTKEVCLMPSLFLTALPNLKRNFHADEYFDFETEVPTNVLKTAYTITKTNGYFRFFFEEDQCLRMIGVSQNSLN